MIRWEERVLNTFIQHLYPLLTDTYKKRWQKQTLPPKSTKLSYKQLTYILQGIEEGQMLCSQTKYDQSEH